LHRVAAVASAGRYRAAAQAAARNVWPVRSGVATAQQDRCQRAECSGSIINRFRHQGARIDPMQTNQPDSNPALATLAALVGEWTQHIDIPGVPSGRTVFEWVLGGSFLLQRNHIPHPDFPDSILIIAANPGGETYTQHYFDSRGVARIYNMTFGGGNWTLLRDARDFAPLDFAQRFSGTFEDERTINGAWEHSDGGVTWKRDFSLSFKKIA
jgi:hypothetical protein